MPAAHGGVTDELEEFIEDELVGEEYESKSEAVSELIRYGAALKHGYNGE